MAKKSFYHISKLVLPFAQPGYIFILNNSNTCRTSFIEEYFDKRDIDNVPLARCIIKLNVTSDKPFNKFISYSTGQIIWSPKSEFIKCQILSMDTFCGLPVLHCAWKTGRFIADLDRVELS